MAIVLKSTSCFGKFAPPFLPTLLLLFSFLLPIAQQHINFVLVDSQIRDYETVFHFQGSALHSCILRRFSTSKFASYLGEFELFSQRKIKNVLRRRIPSALQQGSTSSRCTASSKALPSRTYLRIVDPVAAYLPL